MESRGPSLFPTLMKKNAEGSFNPQRRAHTYTERKLTPKAFIYATTRIHTLGLGVGGQFPDGDQLAGGAVQRDLRRRGEGVAGARSVESPTAPTKKYDANPQRKPNRHTLHDHCEFPHAPIECAHTISLPVRPPPLHTLAPRHTRAREEVPWRSYRRTPSGSGAAFSPPHPGGGGIPLLAARKVRLLK